MNKKRKTSEYNASHFFCPKIYSGMEDGSSGCEAGLRLPDPIPYIF